MTSAPETPSTKRSYRMGERAERVERTRKAILNAVADIGDPREVTLGRAAELAGVSERTVLRQFSSRSNLLDEAIAHLATLVERERFAAPPGEVDAAVANLVSHYETYADQVLWRLAEGATSAEVERINEAGRELHRRWVRETFAPQLENLAPSTRRRRTAQLVAVCDVYSYKLLRRDMGLGVGETKKALAELIRGITEEGP